MHYQRMTIEKEAPEEVGTVVKYNLSESSIADQTLGDLGIEIPRELVLTYTEHAGSQKVRSMIADASNGSLTAEDVLVTAGASTSLFIVATSLLSAKDHLIVTRPNYATNLETPRAIGCEITFIDLEFETGFVLDLQKVAAAIVPGTTKLISVCSPNNPTGSVLKASELERLALLAKENKCYLLVDETYIDLVYPTAGGENQSIPPAASLGDHVIGVSSMSKAYGVPGIRIGWLTTVNKTLQEMFLAAKEQISISGSVLDEWVAEQILKRREELLKATRAEMKARRDMVADWIQSESDLLEWVYPDAGVMSFIHIKKEPVGGTARFYDQLLNDHGVYVGRGRWFERPDTFFRLGYGWPTAEQLKIGLAAISKVLRG